MCQRLAELWSERGSVRCPVSAAYCSCVGRNHGVVERRDLGQMGAAYVNESETTYTGALRSAIDELETALDTIK